MRILVAGGAGFIGSHLVRRLLGQGHEVLCVDNLLTGRRRNIAALEDVPGFAFVEADIIEGLPDLGHIDRIYHLASPASPPGYATHPVATMRVNSEGTRHLLEAAQHHGARFLYTSTSEAYGDPLEHPQRETYRGNVSSTGPRSMYDEAKRYGEALTMTFVRSCGVDGRIVRIFNTYGPMSDPEDGRLVPNFITQALAGQPLTVYGDGQQTRSLCYVSDLVEGLLLAMETPGTCGELMNLGNPEEHTVLEFATRIRDLAASTSSVEFAGDGVGDDPRRRQPDITRARQLLGWEPVVGLESGLLRTIEYFRSEALAPRAVATPQPSFHAPALR
ncbi:MAG: UDP-glucuronic acid decarboxylase family protein [Dehalococcoidia bacterium]|nr:UDP-glucuronic acid decarboxylase family protein [Dehalococcoidia bacterium]